MRRSRTIPGLLLQLARSRGVGTRTVARLGLAAGAVFIAAGVHGLITRQAPAPRSGRADRATTSARALHTARAAIRGSGLALQPSLAWNGDGYGLAWTDARARRVDVYFERLGRDGRRIGAEVVVSPGRGQHLLPRVAFAGNEYGIAWTDVDEDGEDLDVGFARVGIDGARRGEPMRLSRGEALQFGAAPAWDGRAYGVVWNAVNQSEGLSLRFVRIVPGQSPSAEQIVERDALPVGLSSIAWDGREFGIAYAHFAFRRERAEGRLLRVSSEGRALGTLELGATEGVGGVFAIAPASGGLATTWSTITEEGDSSLWIARTHGERVDQAAKQLRREHVLAAVPSIAWNGTVAGVGWTTEQGGRYAIWFARVSREGAIVGAPVAVNTAGHAFESSMVWNGQEFAMAWSRFDRGTRSIVLTRFDAEGRRVGTDVEIANETE